MKPITVMPFGPHRDEPLVKLADAYILSLIAPTRLGVALAPNVEAALNAEWARRRRMERARERRAA